MRVVSLVPSLTETLFALGLDEVQVVGRTAWCVRPEERVAKVPALGGTKTPNIRGIVQLAPDVVLLEREENRRETFEALEAAGIATWVTHVLSVEDVPRMLEDLGRQIERPRRALELAEALRAELQELDDAVSALPALRAIPLIWNKPLMSVSPRRYGGDMVKRAGFWVPDVVSCTSGYPEWTPSTLGESGVEWLLLSSEPHDFTLDEGRELENGIEGAGYPRPRAVKIDGEALTWFGARTAWAVRWWRDFRGALPR